MDEKNAPIDDRTLVLVQFNELGHLLNIWFDDIDNLLFLKDYLDKNDGSGNTCIFIETKKIPNMNNKSI